jgi:hypothetical protein
MQGWENAFICMAIRIPKNQRGDASNDALARKSVKHRARGRVQIWRAPNRSAPVSDEKWPIILNILPLLPSVTYRGCSSLTPA